VVRPDHDGYILVLILWPIFKFVYLRQTNKCTKTRHSYKNFHKVRRSCHLFHKWHQLCFI